MKSPYVWLLILTLIAPSAMAQDPASRTIEIRGDGRPADAEQLYQIWLYPEKYLGTTIKLKGFLFDAQNFEYFPEQNGHLFCCEAVIHRRDSDYHTYIGYATFLSQEKLNFFCSTAEGQRIRELFMSRPDQLSVAADVVLEVQKRDNLYFGVVTSFQPNGAPAPTSFVPERPAR